MTFIQIGHKRLSVSDLTTKLREETGDECKLCGCSYVAAQIVQIDGAGVLGVRRDVTKDSDVRPFLLLL